jgi:prephenate dehydratase
VRIAYQGEPGAYSEAAALRLAPHADTLPCRSFEDVFAAVEAGTATEGIVPIENSIAGSIHRNYELLVEHELPIVGEVELRVEHALLAAPGVRLDSVRRVYSHPQALAQCERFLRSLPGVEIVATYDTAGSAKMIRDEQITDAAAIAAERAAVIFGLSVLRAGIQDYDANITRFLIIRRKAIPIGEPDKTTIVFSVNNQPGALFKALSVFALRDIDLTKLESRPIRGRPWEYLFYADLAISRDDLRCARALVHLGEFARSLRTLGTYPRWKEPREEEAAPGAPAHDQVRSTP